MAEGKITVLAENAARGRGLLGEPGLTFWIRWQGKRVLLKTWRLLACHCTGMAAIARLRREFPGRCAVCPVGTVLEVPA